MKTHYTVTLAMFAGFGLGAVAVQSLHAQVKPSVYLITEVDVINPESYTKDYGPRASASIKAVGGRYLASGGKTQAFDGEPPKRISVIVWDSMEKIQTWRDSAAFKELLPVREKAAKFRSFAIEGVSN